ncbi:MAG: hypothetical protein KF838_04470 [Phycisphaeraceae bacterium]|nr:MAG: hypothetical protein KF838_04470 [Phycisphaeraceae bacterium]
MDSSGSSQATSFEQFVIERIRFRVYRLQRVFPLSEHDAEDVAQQMQVEVLGAMTRYRSGRSSERTYACRVLDRAYCNLAKKLRKRRATTVRLEAVAHILTDARDPRPCVDLALDVAEAVSALPDGLRGTALALMHHNPKDAADSRGLHRGTVYRQMRAIEPHLAHLVRNE